MNTSSAVMSDLRLLDTFHDARHTEFEVVAKSFENFGLGFRSIQQASLDDFFHQLNEQNGEQVVSSARNAGEGAGAEESLSIIVAGRQEWDENTLSNLQGFIDNWTNLRPMVSQAVFDCYVGIYPTLRRAVELYEPDPAADVARPEPKSPADLEAHYLIDALSFHIDGSVGISGLCSWDDEEGFGLKIINGQVSRVGTEDCALLS